MGKNPLVLVFEDRDDQFEMLRAALRELKLRVKRAATPEEFQRLAPFEGFEFIMVDLYYGEARQDHLVGIDLTKELRKSNGDVPVIVASSFAPERGIVADAFHAGATTYVDKQDFVKDPMPTIQRIREQKEQTEESRMEKGFPLPMAFLLSDFRLSETSSKRSFERMVELFEVTLKTVTYSLLAAHRDSLLDTLDPKLSQALAQPSLGHLLKVTQQLPVASNFLRALSLITQRAEFQRICGELIQLRNDYIGHGARQEERVYRELVDRYAPELMELLRMLACFRKWYLVVTFGSHPLPDPESGFMYEMKIFRGANPIPFTEKRKSTAIFRPASGQQWKHGAFLADEHLEQYVDCFPWIQYLVCEQRCLAEKLFLFRQARKGQVWMLDHVYGHALTTSYGWRELYDLTQLADGTG